MRGRGRVVGRVKGRVRARAKDGDGGRVLEAVCRTEGRAAES